MDKLIIEGGQQLNGEISASGSKNATLPILFASILADSPTYLCGAPHLSDLATAIRLIVSMGASVRMDENGCMEINSQNLNRLQADYDLVKTMRASILALGPVLARYGEARISMPGGCAIGARPVDLHIRGLQALGAHIEIKQGYICARTEQLRGAHIHFEKTSVTATENIIMAATFAKGQTVIDNAAYEPEVTDLIHYLNKMGADISGAGTSTITINGVDSLHGADYTVSSDRIEVGTYLVATAITSGRIRIHRADAASVQAVLDKLTEAGAKIEVEPNTITLDMTNKRPKAVNIKTATFPGFPTDMQAQFVTLNSIASGSSAIVETIFENRFMHIAELNRMGADLSLQGNTVMCRGVDRLKGATVMATDLRASACLVLAGLVAQGKTTIERVYHLDRGYDTIEEKLQKMGANIQRLKI